MPNDAKLGLLTGLTAVLLIGLVFFRKEGAAEVVPSPAPAPLVQTTPTPAPEPEPAELPALPPPDFGSP